MDRRNVLRAAGVGSLTAVATAAGLAATEGTAAASADGLTNRGAGIYTDLSVASQLSAFSILNSIVTCGVGTVGAAGLTGPFSMLMYSTNISMFRADRAARTLTAKGRMISITMVAGLTQENVEHDFLAIAKDNRGAGADRFDVHFLTSFWSPSNPMATPSDVVDGWVRFGGGCIRDLLGTQMGGVSVG
ncbi:MAG: hypothetical protein ACRDT6_22725 [Micromonosporaceae bacterium]